MNKLTIKEKLRIANSGGSFRETGTSNWEGTLICKGKKYGEVIEDWNGTYRILKVKFQDGTIEEIKLNNIGKDPKSVHQYKWYCEQNKEWIRF